jgi:hypothetical protein
MAAAGAQSREAARDVGSVEPGTSPSVWLPGRDVDLKRMRMRGRSAGIVAAAVVAGGALLATTGATRGVSAMAAPAPVATVAADTGAPARASSAVDVAAMIPGLDSLDGLSGKLRVRFLARTEGGDFANLRALLGDRFGAAPGVYAADSLIGRPFAFIAMRPFSDKVRGRIGTYRMGTWPFEGRTPRSKDYANPEGFIEVTPENQDTYVSEHFRLRDFLTKDQRDVWPKYLVLDAQLIDKLELVIDQLNADGYRVNRLAVMSGFRTPQYNEKGVGAGGRAATSRHQYGDAADVFVDNDGDGWTDDVNGDGRVNTRDAVIVKRAAEKVEQRFPQLLGGIGLYTATPAHGPFTHIDARGTRARWGVEG